jgi:hypothetical protein
MLTVSRYGIYGCSPSLGGQIQSTIAFCHEFRRWQASYVVGRLGEAHSQRVTRAM